MVRPLSIPAIITVLAVIGAFFSGRCLAQVTLDRSFGTLAVMSSPSTEPTAEPTLPPAISPSLNPSVNPSAHPSQSPSMVPSMVPSARPTFLNQPTAPPSIARSSPPSRPPTRSPTNNPTKLGAYVGRGELPTDLGLAANFAIFASTTVTSTEAVGTVITGNIGTFPGFALTGFPPGVLNGAAALATGDSVNAQMALATAYRTLTEKGSNTTLSNKDLGGITLIPGVYKFHTAAAMNGVLTLDARGDAAAVWVFQIGTLLNVAPGSSVVFKDGFGNPDYVYWRVGAATMGAGASMVGNVIAFQSIVLNDGVTVKGRCASLTAAVTLDRSVITLPATIAFKATQTIVGLSLAQYSADIARNAATLMEAIAKTMAGIVPSDIKNLQASAGLTSSATSRTIRRMTARALATDSIVLNYDVIASSTATAQDLRNQLKNAVSDGTFNTYLQAAAAERGATSLQSATSDSVETDTIVEEETDSSTSSLSDGAIVGIAIGGFFALLLLGSIVYLCTSKSNSVSVGASQSTTTQEV